MKTKVIAFDVYGTILCANDPENAMPPRRGFIEFAKNCQKEGIVLVTSSDNELPLTKIDLKESGVPIELFFDHYQMMVWQPKYFLPIVEFFAIQPDELLVFGDRPECDIEPAIKQGCRAVLVPPYNTGDSFDWMSMIEYL